LLSPLFHFDFSGNSISQISQRSSWTTGFSNFPLKKSKMAASSYPLKVAYCGECSMPPEYCEYGPFAEKCKAWLQKNIPDLFQALNVGEEGGEGAGKEGEGTATEGDKSKRQTRGGKASKAKKKADTKEPKVQLASSSRGKRTTTLVIGLSTCGVKLKDASKFFANKFAAAASVTGEDEILIQGDVKDDLFDIIEEKFNVDPDFIHDIGTVKR